MPTPTYVPLGNITLSNSASQITFGSIPTSFKDLVLVIKGAFTGSGEGYFYLDFNGDTGANYNRVVMYANGSTASSATFANLIPITLRDSQSQHLSHIMDYSSTDKHKVVLTRNDTSADLFALVGRWANTAAINSVRIRAYAAYSLATGTTISLYGIAG